MKKRRILIIGLSFALLMVMLVPSAAMAKTNNWQTPAYTDFTGGGYILVTAMPDPLINCKLWSFKGEIVQGVLAQCDWDLLTNTAFWSTHDSIVKVEDDGTAFGWMWGTFTLSIDESNVMTGSFNGKITGNLYLGYISDTGSWSKTRGTGVFKDVSAYGEWSADLVYDEYVGTLAGPLSWQGKYAAGSTKYIRSCRNSYNWSPVKSWRPYTPGMFSWFRRY